MSEWWTYSPADFLLFSPKTYYRLLELHNAATWPGHLLAIVLGCVILFLVARPGAARERILATILAACWLWVAWAYLLARYATINWAARYFAMAFAVEAILLIVFNVVAGRLSINRKERLPGMALLVFALAIQPLLGPLLGRPWTQAESFGVTPNPTVVATLAVLALSTHWSRWLLLAIPALWCLIAGLTEWAMASPEAWVMPLAMAVAVVLTVRNSPAEGPDPQANVGRL